MLAIMPLSSTSPIHLIVSSFSEMTRDILRLKSYVLEEEALRSVLPHEKSEYSISD